MNMPAENIQRMVDLSELLAGIADAPSLSVSGMSSDSRRIRSAAVGSFLASQASRPSAPALPLPLVALVTTPLPRSFRVQQL